jgi:hypothetical protein
VDRLTPGFVFQYRSTGHEPLSQTRSVRSGPAKTSTRHSTRCGRLVATGGTVTT